MSLISSWLSTKTFAIVNIADYRWYTILSSIGTTLVSSVHEVNRRPPQMLRLFEERCVILLLSYQTLDVTRDIQTSTFSSSNVNM